ncbi:MAG: MFS transporter [Planctomyces sp.]|nr:MFS transporter [Planctomyces sp.]
MLSPMLTADTPRPSLLRSGGFVGLIATQFLGAFNDNMFRWLAVNLGQRSMDDTAALAIGGALFTIPYLVLAPLAGSLADRNSKRGVIIACKVAEIVLMILGVLAMLLGNLPFLFGCVFLMGAQSALFSPAKFGVLPETLGADELSKGNGIMGLATVVASALGLVAGYQLYGAMQPLLDAGRMLSALVLPGAALIGVAVLGTLTSLLVQSPPAANPLRRLEWNPVTETWPALQVLGRDIRLLRAALGIGFFWMLAALAQMNVDPLGEGLGLDKQDVGVLMAVLVAGLGSGSVLAGVWSQGKVELGIVPLGALGICLSAFAVYGGWMFVDPGAPPIHQPAFFACCAALFGLGVAAGLFDVPLEAYLQHRSDTSIRGTVLAGSNFISFALILASFGLFALMREVLHLSPAAIFMVAGLGTIPVLVYALRLLPNMTARFLFWLASNLVYRLRVSGREHIPERGGALLVANHVSWVDGILVLVSSSRFVRFLVYADYANAPLLRWLAGIMGVIPIKASDGPKAIVRALGAAREAIERGEVVCIFAEGQLTRTGQLQPFQRGLLKIVQGTNAPIIPTYLHGLWGSIFSFKGGRFFWKKPSVWRYPVSIHFGKPLSAPDDVFQVRRAVEELGVEANEMAKERELVPVRRFLRQSRRSARRLKAADSTGLEVTGGKLLVFALALLRVLSRGPLANGAPRVGVLLPPSVFGCVANMSLALGRRTSVNLNYTLTDAQINYCVQKAGLQHVLTSRKFLEKRPVALEGAEFVFLEDLKTQITGWDKAIAALLAYATPLSILESLLKLPAIRPEDELTIIFTSGSTGEPKGVVLTQSNIGSNVQAVDHLLQLKPSDTLLGILPMFHSFGYTATLWLPMCFDAAVAFHFNPLDAKIVGKLCEKYKVTLILSTPTFLRTYMRRCDREQFAHLDMVVVGAEKLPLDLAKEFQEKFGVLPSEGYGTTELSPVAAVNIPDHRSLDTNQQGSRLGTVGRVIPGCAAKVVDADTFADLGNNREGLLLITGPNVMRGYLDEPQKTADVVRDGWYVTGDFAKIDDDGFIQITGRQSRFSKIGGEMVPHLRIEEELMRLVDVPGSEETELKVAVTSAPDPLRGERLIVLHRPLNTTPAELIRELSAAGLPNLWLPSSDSFYEVEQIPILGTGKLDLRGMKQMALELASGGKRTAGTEAARVG